MASVNGSLPARESGAELPRDAECAPASADAPALDDALPPERETRLARLWRELSGRSVFGCSRRHTLRRACIRLVRGVVMERFILLVVMTNLIMLCTHDPLDVADEQPRNRAIRNTEQLFNAIFTAEMLIKFAGTRSACACGVSHSAHTAGAQTLVCCPDVQRTMPSASTRTLQIGGIGSLHVPRRAWGSDACAHACAWHAWCRLDFALVILGFASLSPDVSNVSAFRTVRALRALRTLTVVPSMRVVVLALSNSVFPLARVRPHALCTCM